MNRLWISDNDKTTIYKSACGSAVQRRTFQGLTPSHLPYSATISHRLWIGGKTKTQKSERTHTRPPFLPACGLAVTKRAWRRQRARSPDTAHAQLPTRACVAANAGQLRIARSTMRRYSKRRIIQTGAAFNAFRPQGQRAADTSEVCEHNKTRRASAPGSRRTNGGGF